MTVSNPPSSGHADSSQHFPPGISRNPDDSFNPEKFMLFQEMGAPKNKEWSDQEEKENLGVKLNAWLQEERASDSNYPQLYKDEATESLLMPSDYLLKRVVGEGGCGEVWEGIQHSMGRVVAVKRLRPEKFGKKSKDEKVVRYLEQNFRHEALTTAHLEHPNIVPVYDLGSDERGLPLLAMKLVRGRRWTEIIDEDRTLSMPDFLGKHLPILIDVSQAVAFAHSRGIIHRDIKPSQVMIGEFGEVLLMDWGLSLIYDYDLVHAQAPKFANKDYTPSGKYASSPAGTPAYMALEQTLARANQVGPWTDIFLLAGTLYYLLTGATPNKGSDSTEAFDFATKEPVDPPEIRVKNTDIPRELSQLAMRGLKRNPKDRLTSAVKFIDHLKDYLTGSSKRSEANNLLKRAAELARLSNSKDYNELDECVNLIESSVALWPENDQAYRLRQTIITQYARAALENRDLRLARMQAERLDPSPDRKLILEDIGKFEATQKNTDKQLANAHSEVVDAKDRAEKARKEAEGLVSFMLQDLFTNLQVIKRTEILHEVAQKALLYFEENPDKEQTVETLESRGKTLNNIGDVFRSRGNYAEAIKAYNDSHHVFQTLFRREPENDTWRLALSEYHESMAELNRMEEKYEEALRSTRIALDIRQRLAAQRPDVEEFMSALADSYHQEGETLNDYDQLDASMKNFAKARSIREMIYRNDPENKRAAKAFAESLNSEAKIHQSNQEFERAKNLVADAIQIRRYLYDQYGQDVQYHLALADSLKTKAIILESANDLHGAREQYREAISILEAMLRQDPTNPTLLIDLVQLNAALGRCYQVEDHYQQSQEAFENAVSYERQVSAHSQIAQRFQGKIIELYLDLAELYLDQDSVRESRKVAKTATEFLSNIDPKYKKTDSYLINSARAYIIGGRIYQRNNDIGKAKKAWESARKQVMSHADIELRPGKYTALMVMALIYLDEWNEAEQYLKGLESAHYSNQKFLRFCDKHGVDYQH